MSSYEDSSLSDGVIVVERHYERDLDGRTRAARFLSRALAKAGLAFGLATGLAVFQLLAVVTVDLPLSLFDRIAGPGGMVPSAFLSRGEGLFLLIVLATLLVSRRWGARVVASAVTLSWVMTAVFVLMLIVELAPSLEDSDVPEVRFVSALVGSWIVSQWAAVWTYEVFRGGLWWRAPLFGAAVGYGFQALVYFPSAFAGTPLPWAYWMALQLIIGLMIACLFVLIYGPLRWLIRPGLGLGGR
ncbi:MAG: VUT family protein [Parvularculaceae bacterium]|nr:VUT family protein [Parvularculaceae bacterium]